MQTHLKTITQWYAGIVVFMLALINATKVPAGDLYNYYNALEVADSALNFSEFYVVAGYEMFFSLFMYIIGKYSSTPEFLFSFSLTVLGYTLIHRGIVNLFGGRGRDVQVALSFSLIALNPILFSLSLHLLRQFIAFSIVFWVLSAPRQSIYLMATFAVAILTHYVSILLLAGYSVFVLKSLSVKRIFHLFLILSAMFCLVWIFQDSVVLLKVISRLSAADTKTIGGSSYLIGVCFFILTALCFRYRNEPIVFVTAVMSLPLSFVAFFGFFSELYVRLMMWVYIILPVLLVWYIAKHKSVFKITFALAALLMPAWFSVGLMTSPWQYFLFEVAS